MSKKEAILKSVLRLVNREGFYHLSMKKIAQEAQIAAGTIYIYFEGKEHLINDLYRMCVASFNETVLSVYREDAPIDENFRILLTAAIDFYIQHPDYFSFVEQYTYAPFLFKENQEENFVLLLPIFKMLQKGKEAGILKDALEQILLANVHGPLNTMIKLHLAKKINLKDQMIKAQFVNLCWQNISIN